MYIINFTFLVSDAAAGKWLQWLRSEHIPGMVATGLIHTPQLTRVLSQEQDGGVSYAVQYKSDNIANLNQWHQEHAQLMQSECRSLFGEEVLFFSTVLEVLNTL